MSAATHGTRWHLFHPPVWAELQALVLNYWALEVGEEVLAGSFAGLETCSYFSPFRKIFKLARQEHS